MKFHKRNKEVYMKNINKQIKKLAKLKSKNASFISLYLNTKWENDDQKERVRIFFNRKSDNKMGVNHAIDATTRNG